MGVRISLYAVDIPAIEDFAKHSLGYVLQYYSKHGDSQFPSLGFSCQNSGHLELYLADIGKGISYYDGKRRVILSEQSIENNSFLSTSLDEYLIDESSSDLYRVLAAYAQCPAIDWVTKISEGHRRWWIGSFLEYVKLVLGNSSNMYFHFANLFQRLLGNYDCGTILPPKEDVPSIPLSFVPVDNSDPYMSFWSQDEICFLCQTIRMVIADNRARFKRPPDKVGLGPGPDEDWNDWVYEVLQELLVLESPSLENRIVLTFIE